MTTNTNTTASVRRSHADCAHPATKVARAACRRGAARSTSFLFTNKGQGVEALVAAIASGMTRLDGRFDIDPDTTVKIATTGTVAIPVLKLDGSGTRPYYVKADATAKLEKPAA